MLSDQRLLWCPVSMSHGLCTDPDCPRRSDRHVRAMTMLKLGVNIKLFVSAFIAVCFNLLGIWSPGSAQVASGPLPAQQPPVVSSPTPQPPAVSSPVPPVGAPAGSGISAKIITSATTNRLAPNFRSAGRGLPGMPGGPPLTSSLGARDPRPPTVGPLFCDPAVDFPC
jgi:hypothetical protein